jgi:hypothetical protein
MLGRKLFKKGSDAESFFDIGSTVLLIILLIFLFNIFFTSCQHDTTEFMFERHLSNLHKESFFLFLMSPIDSPNPISLYNEKVSFYNNEQLLRKYSLPLILKEQGSEFEIYADDVKNIKNISMEIHLSHNSNIAIIEGSSDNILSILKDIDIHPDIIAWNELNSDHKFVFAGCSSDLPNDKQKIIDWINNGGTLITTDYSIEIIESLFGKGYVYSNKILLNKNPIEIEFTNEAQNILGLSGTKSIKDVFWVDLQNQSTILAEYKNIDGDEPCLKTNEGCGYPIHTFTYGNGRVIHFSFHLSENKEITETLFKKSIQVNNIPSHFAIYEKISNELIVEEQGLFLIDGLNLDLTKYFLNCHQNCSVKFFVIGDGQILLRQPVINYALPSIYNYDQISFADYMVQAFSEYDINNDIYKMHKVRIITEQYLNQMSTDTIAHRITFYDEPNQMYERFNVVSDKFRENVFTIPSIKIEAEYELKLYNNESVYVTLESGLTTYHSTVTRLRTFFLLGGPVGILI